jgi:hypothetical protein
MAATSFDGIIISIQALRSYQSFPSTQAIRKAFSKARTFFHRPTALSLKSP